MRGRALAPVLAAAQDVQLLELEQVMSPCVYLVLAMMQRQLLGTRTIQGCVHERGSYVLTMERVASAA